MHKHKAGGIWCPMLVYIHDMMNRKSFLNLWMPEKLANAKKAMVRAHAVMEPHGRM
jgi:hypothetical protein